jgi:hypothetical protein
MYTPEGSAERFIFDCALCVNIKTSFPLIVFKDILPEGPLMNKSFLTGLGKI